jgi:L-ascorbate metabolism protein UlaG (beta-lactamase superfamily)
MICGMSFTIRALGGPTAILEIGGLRLVTDPTFDEPRDYPIGDRKLTKLAATAIGPEEVGPVDAVLLSHDQHPDNLDEGGRTFLTRVPLVLTTAVAAGRLGGAARGVPLWEHVELPRPGGGVLRITRVPALHGPEDSLHLVGEVAGFVLSGDGLPTVYVSGDNASLEVVAEVAARFGSFDIAMIFAGAARTTLAGGALLTVDSAGAAEAVRILDARHAVPVHHDGWAHFTEGGAELTKAFAEAGLTDRLTLLAPGESATLDV